MQPEGVLESCLYAEDLGAAEAFYTEVLGLERFASEPGRHVFFRCGSGMVLLFQPEVTGARRAQVGESLLPLHGASGSGHLAFRVSVEALPGWRSRLEAAGVEIESEITWPHGGRSLYFRDPAGNSLELATPDLWGLS